jgi:hypothetical protein
MDDNKTRGLALVAVLLVGAVIMLFSQSQTLTETQTSLEVAQSDLTSAAEAFDDAATVAEEEQASAVTDAENVAATAMAEALDDAATIAEDEQADAVADAENIAATAMAEALDDAATVAEDEQASAVTDAENIAATAMAEALDDAATVAEDEQASAVTDAENVAATAMAQALDDAATIAADEQADAIAAAEEAAAVAMAEALDRASTLAEVELAVAVDIAQNSANLTTADSPLASMMPDTVGIYATSRVGADVIAEIDAMNARIYDRLPESMAFPTDSVDSIMRQLFAEQRQDWDEIIGLVGDYAAIGIEPVGGLENGEDPLVLFAIEITDQKGAEDLFVKATESNSDEIVRTRIRTNVYFTSEREDFTVILTPNHFIATNYPDFTPVVESPLSESEAYTSAIAMLPAEHYNAFVYVSEAILELAFSEIRETEQLEQLGFKPEDAGAVVVGTTMLGSSTYAIDVAVQTLSPMPTSFVSTDFLEGMPSSTDAFIVATDLTNVYNSITDSIGAMARANDEPDPTEDIAAMAGFIGLDLEEDILSWTTGGYGVFAGTDVLSLINEFMETGSVSEINVDAGIIIEATDVGKAKNTAAKLGEIMAQMAEGIDEVTITQDDTATNIILSAPIDPSMPPIELEFVLTATDTFFFFGTRSALDKIMSGDTLATDVDFAKSTQFYLENPTSVTFISSDGVILTTAAPLMIAGPMINNIFEDVVNELGGESTSSGDTAMPRADEMFMEMFQIYDELFSSMTLTTSVDENGVVRLRGTLSMNQ